LTYPHRRVLYSIAHCRTAALGGHIDGCSRCGYRADISYNSCGSRHCPKCLTHARDLWLAERAKECLPVGYFHVVFTLPHELSWLALHNKKTVYNLLFRAAADTLLQVAADPQRLGAEVGFLSVLHSWGQNLQFHPHLHCILPSGGLSFDHQRWVHPRHAFLPVKVLGKMFRGKFTEALKKDSSGAHCSFPVRSRPSGRTKLFARSCVPLIAKTGSSTPSRHSAGQRICYSIWRVIPIASLFPITASSTSPTAESRSGGRTMRTAASSGK